MYIYNNIETSSIKYTTQHPGCVINDVARHFNSGYGYSVK